MVDLMHANGFGVMIDCHIHGSAKCGLDTNGGASTTSKQVNHKSTFFRHVTHSTYAIINSSAMIITVSILIAKASSPSVAEPSWTAVWSGILALDPECSREHYQIAEP
jgi:hypothetical protein